MRRHLCMRSLRDMPSNKVASLRTDPLWSSRPPTPWVMPHRTPKTWLPTRRTWLRRSSSKRPKQPVRLLPSTSLKRLRVSAALSFHGCSETRSSINFRSIVRDLYEAPASQPTAVTLLAGLDTFRLTTLRINHAFPQTGLVVAPFTERVKVDRLDQAAFIDIRHRF